jgi:hypothetical protein
MLYAFFWVIPRGLKFICQSFGKLCLFHLHRRPMKMGQCVPKCWHIKFRRRGITQKKAYNIQNTAKVWHQELPITTQLYFATLDMGIQISPTLEYPPPTHTQKPRWLIKIDFAYHIISRIILHLFANAPPPLVGNNPHVPVLRVAFLGGRWVGHKLLHVSTFFGDYYRASSNMHTHNRFVNTSSVLSFYTSLFNYSNALIIRTGSEEVRLIKLIG